MKEGSWAGGGVTGGSAFDGEINYELEMDIERIVSSQTRRASHHIRHGYGGNSPVSLYLNFTLMSRQLEKCQTINKLKLNHLKPLKLSFKICQTFKHFPVPNATMNHSILLFSKNGN